MIKPESISRIIIDFSTPSTKISLFLNSTDNKSLTFDRNYSLLNGLISNMQQSTDALVKFEEEGRTSASMYISGSVFLSMLHWMKNSYFTMANPITTVNLVDSKDQFIEALERINELLMPQLTKNDKFLSTLNQHGFIHEINSSMSMIKLYP